MRRRQALLTAAAAALAAPALAQANRALTFGYILPEDSQLGAGARVFDTEIRARTAGRYRIESHPDSQLGGEVEMMKAVQLGTIDFAFVTGSALVNVVPDAGAFTIPFLFPDAPAAHRVLDGPVGQDILAKFREQDLIALAWGENGMRQLTSGKKPLRTPEDLRGVKLRVPQSDVMVLGFKTLGADVATLAFPALFNALRAGQFDAQENPIATIRAAKFWQVQKHLTLSNHVYDPAAILMAPDTWDDMTPDDRAAVTAAAKLAGAASRAFAAEAQEKGIQALAQAGMEVVPRVDRAQFVAAIEPAVPAFEKMFGADLVNRLKTVG